MHYFLVYGLLILNFHISSSQIFEKSYSIKGKIVDSKTKEGIANTLVTIIETNESLFADTLGNFVFSLSIDRHIKISALGYHSKTIYLKNIFNKENNFIAIVELEPKSYQLKEILVHNLGTWEEFKEKFITEKISDPEYWKKKRLSNMIPIKNMPDTANYGFIPLQYEKPRLHTKESLEVLKKKPYLLPYFLEQVINHPAKVLYHKLATSTKKHKEEVKLYQMIKRQEQIDENKLSYNEELIISITKFTNPDSIRMFKQFCDAYIILDSKQTELTVISQVSELFEKFKKRKIK